MSADLSHAKPAHTPEPWKVFYGDKLILGVGETTGEGITDGQFALWRSGEEMRANAERIVACVNFCQGVESEKLASLSHPSIYRAMELEPGGSGLVVVLCHLDRLKQQRDELLAALVQAERALAATKTEHPSLVRAAALASARSAIANTAA